jgi:2-oxoglutarate ferredoxin oxidoreductase subunit delta
MASKVTISAKHCKGCKLCISACPRKALKLTGRYTHAGIEIIEWDASSGCTACLLCTAMCPDAAITIEEVDETKAAKPPKR